VPVLVRESWLSTSGPSELQIRFSQDHQSSKWQREMIAKALAAECQHQTIPPVYSAEERKEKRKKQRSKRGNENFWRHGNFCAPCLVAPLVFGLFCLLSNGSTRARSTHRFTGRPNSISHSSQHTHSYTASPKCRRPMSLPCFEARFRDRERKQAQTKRSLST